MTLPDALEVEDVLYALENPAEATRAIRERVGMSQRDFARHLGVSRGCVRHIEAGRNGPSRETLVKILRVAEESL